MNNTRQHEEFECYCLDRGKPLTEEIPITYNDGSIIRKILYKIGLKAKIKHHECFILYTESDADLDQFIYIDVDNFYDNQCRFFNDILHVNEVQELLKRLNSINIFEFTSLLEFEYIYEDFKSLIEYNWNSLEMDSLIEI